MNEPDPVLKMCTDSVCAILDLMHFKWRSLNTSAIDCLNWGIGALAGVDVCLTRFGLNRKDIELRLQNEQIKWGEMVDRGPEVCEQFFQRWTENIKERKDG